MNNEDLINNYGSLVKVITNSDIGDNEDDDDENENYEYLSYIEEDDDGSSTDNSNSNDNRQNDLLKKHNDDYNNHENNMFTETEVNNIIKTEYDHDDNYDDDDYIIYDSGNDDAFDVNDYNQEKDENPNEMIIIEDKYDNFDDHNNDPDYYIIQDNEKIEEPEQLNDVITMKNDEKCNKNENDEKCNKNDGSEELYHCNTCNVVFNSINEHLIEFHQNEDIHIEEKTKNNKKSVKQTQKTEAEKITFSNKEIENNTYEDINAYSDTYTDANADANANTNPNPNNGNEYEVNKKDDKCIDKKKPIKSIDINNTKNDNSNSNYLEIERITENSNSKNRNKIHAVKNKNTITKKKIEKEQYVIDTIDTDKDLYNQKKFFRNSVNGVSHMCMQCNKQFKILQDAESHICEKSNINIGLEMKPLTVTARNQNNGKDIEKRQQLEQSSYTCDECGMSFNSNRSVSLHKRVHKGSNMMTTTITNKNVDNVATSSNEHDTKFICVECNTIFKSLKSLKLHSKMHKSNGTVSSFDRIINSEQTIIGKSGHLSNEYFFCKICDKFYDKVFEDVHYKAHEIETRSVICMICNRKFDNETECSIHMKLHENHPQRRGITKAEIAGIQLPYECSYCGRQFKKPHEKVKHERIHTGEKPHRCDICGKSFRVSYCLTLHIRSHTNARPYVCPTCNKRFKSVAVYTHHLQSHSDTRGYKCPLCPKTFKTAVSLAGHRKSHTKPFSCVECNRPFASLYAVKSHMETHKKNKTNLKHTCIICGAIYAKIFALRDHIKNQHNDVAETNDLDIININNDEIISTNIDDDDIIEYNDNDDDIIMNDDTITVTEITDPASIIIGGSYQTLINSKSDEIVDLRNFHTEEIVTEWLGEE